MTLHLSSAVVDLTPRHPVSLGGFAVGPRISTGVHSGLEANIVLLAGARQTVAFVSLDLLFVGRELRNVIEAAAHDVLGSTCEVVTLASHTHFAPMLDPLKPGLGELDRPELDRWTAKLREAFARLSKPARCDGIRRGSGTSTRAVNRRRHWPWPTAAGMLGRAREGTVYLADNPDGPIDESVGVWIWTSGGAPVAAMWAFSCHPTGYPDHSKVSSEFPGVVRQVLRRHLGAGLPVLYAPTCMGDVRPRTGERAVGLRRAVDLALYGPRSGGFSPAGWDEWSRALAEEVMAVAACAGEASIDDPTVVTRRASIPTATFVEGRCPTPEVVFRAIKTPGVGCVVTLSCEPVTEVGPLVGAQADLVVGYEGDVFGYLPVDRMLREGGYEAGGFFPPFGMTGALKPGIDDILRSIGNRLISEIASGA